MLPSIFFLVYCSTNVSWLNGHYHTIFTVNERDLLIIVRPPIESPLGCPWRSIINSINISIWKKEKNDKYIRSEHKDTNENKRSGEKSQAKWWIKPSINNDGDYYDDDDGGDRDDDDDDSGGDDDDDDDDDSITYNFLLSVKDYLRNAKKETFFNWQPLRINRQVLFPFFTCFSIFDIQLILVLSWLWSVMVLHSVFFLRMLFFRPSLNILVFLLILGWKYSCIILSVLKCIKILIAIKADFFVLATSIEV